MLIKELSSEIILATQVELEDAIIAAGLIVDDCGWREEMDSITRATRRFSRSNTAHGKMRWFSDGHRLRPNLGATLRVRISSLSFLFRRAARLLRQAALSSESVWVGLGRYPACAKFQTDPEFRHCFAIQRSSGHSRSTGITTLSAATHVPKLLFANR